LTERSSDSASAHSPRQIRTVEEGNKAPAAAELASAQAPLGGAVDIGDGLTGEDQDAASGADGGKVGDLTGEGSGGGAIEALDALVDHALTYLDVAEAGLGEHLQIEQVELPR
jgi:hypothetical protein